MHMCGTGYECVNKLLLKEWRRMNANYCKLMLVTSVLVFSTELFMYYL